MRVRSSKRSESTDKQKRAVIVCVDDEPTVLTSLRRQLREVAPACRIEVARSGADALSVMNAMRDKGREIALVISDQLMPEMTGDELLVETAKRHPHTYQIMLTGQAGAEAVGRVINEGRLFRFLAKPWSFADLHVSVTAALKAYHQEREIELQAQALKRAYERSLQFVPQQYLRILGRERLEDVVRGDAVGMNVAVLFADLRGFTSLIEAMTPQESFDFVNSYFLATEPAVIANGGFVDHYQGDGIMALFPEGPRGAVKASVEFCRAVETFNAKGKTSGRPAVDLGIGIHCGDVIAGVSGGEKSLQCGVIGDCVNSAARLEGLSARYGARVVISGEILEALGPEHGYTIRWVETVRAKGKQLPLTVYEIIDGLPEEIRKERIATLPAYQAGSEAITAGKIAKALGAFAEVVAESPNDLAAQGLLDRCHYLIRSGNAATPPDALSLTEKRW